MQRQAVRADIRNWARGQVTAAVSRGDLKKLPCEVCGSEVDIEAHHEDYERPLDVRWLCKADHERAHHPISATKTGVVNIRGVDRSLLRAMKAEAAKSGRTLRDWVIWVWAANVGWENGQQPSGADVSRVEGSGTEPVLQSGRVGVDEIGVRSPEVRNHEGMGGQLPDADQGVNGGVGLDVEAPARYEPFGEEGHIDETQDPDCPHCDTRLMMWTKPGPYKGQWVCKECDLGFTVERLRKMRRI
jgi:hypothetical protein